MVFDPLSDDWVGLVGFWERKKEEGKRFFPAVGGKEEVDGVIVHFGFALQVAVYHFADWGCSVWGEKGVLASVWVVKVYEERVTWKSDCFYVVAF